MSRVRALVSRDVITRCLSLQHHLPALLLLVLCHPALTSHLLHAESPASKYLASDPSLQNEVNDSPLDEHSLVSTNGVLDLSEEGLPSPPHVTRPPDHAGVPDTDYSHGQVKVTPEFTSNSTKQFKNKGDTLKLFCEVESIPRARVRWSFNNIQLPRSSARPRRVVVDRLNHTLTIYRLTHEDTGVYGCSAKNKVGVAYQESIVIVRKKRVTRQTKTGFTCLADSSNILEEEICDGTADCDDLSDETDVLCSKRKCKRSLGLDSMLETGDDLLTNLGVGEPGTGITDSFRCDYGACIPSQFFCDGIPNCIDGSDEKPPRCTRKCSRGKLQCNNAKCVSRSRVCNGRPDCPGGEDETILICAASKKDCRPPLAACDYGACYRKSKECDGEKDCHDGSDEKPELCNKIVDGSNPVTKPTDIGSSTTSTLPPPTPPATDPPPSVVFPGPVGGGGPCEPPYCRCPAEKLSHICLPCHEITDIARTCDILLEPQVCSIYQAEGVVLELMHCGSEEFVRYVSFERDNAECETSKMVPVMSTVFVDCWSTAQMVMRCHSDTMWRPIGQSSTNNTNAMEYLCQPTQINSEVCGKRPRFTNTGNDFFISENRWPWVAGLKKKEQYACSATLISPTFLVTAAHCVIETQESQNKTMDVRDLKVQIGNSRHHKRASNIFLFPEYKPAATPLGDIALIELEMPITFNDKIYPACVDLDADGFLQGGNGVTFRRPSGKDSHEYDLIIQRLDPNCYAPAERCAQTPIAESQFCGADIDKKQHLVGGSSGGPYLHNLGDDFLELFAVTGVMSVVRNQTSCGYTTNIFTNISPYKDFILKHVPETLG